MVNKYEDITESVEVSDRAIYEMNDHGERKACVGYIHYTHHGRYAFHKTRLYALPEDVMGAYAKAVEDDIPFNDWIKQFLQSAIQIKRERR